MNKILRAPLRAIGLDIVKKQSLEYLKSRSNLYDMEGQLARLLESKQVNHVLDVGGNLGHYGLKLRKMGYSGKISSFEPISEIYELLETASKDDPLWDAFHYALGDQNTEQQINISSNLASSSFMKMNEHHKNAAPDSIYRENETVIVNRLSSVWPELTTDSDKVFMKVDVQGFEESVIKGSLDIIDKIEGIQLECSFTPLYEGEMLFTDMFKWMQELGFTLWSLAPTFIEPKTEQLLQVDAVFFRS